MAGLAPTNGGVEVGGMMWEVKRAGEIPGGQVMSMDCVEDRGHRLGTVLDQTRIVLLEDGEINFQLATQGPDGTVEMASHPFAKGTLRAILDFVEAQDDSSNVTEPTNKEGWFGRLLARVIPPV
jgi:hypothetical protein